MQDTGQRWRTEKVAKGQYVLSLFSGSGLLDRAFIDAGYHVRLGLDIFPAAVETVRRNNGPLGEHALQADLAAWTYKDVCEQWFKSCPRSAPLGIIGGPPCQGFSAGNVRQSSDDPRRKLIMNYLDIVRGFNDEYGLDFFVFENVPGILSEKNWPAFAAFLAAAKDAGFVTHFKVVNAYHFGVPQDRRRVIVVGINEDIADAGTFEIPGGDDFEPHPIDTVLKGLPEPVVAADYRGREDEVPYHPNHWMFRPLSKKFEQGILPGSSHGRSFRRLEWGKPSPTVAYGNREVAVHPDGHRRLSIYEAMLLQGYPASYRLAGTITDQCTLVSDAVPYPVGHAVAKSLAAFFDYGIWPNESLDEPAA